MTQQMFQTGICILIYSFEHESIDYSHHKNIRLVYYTMLLTSRAWVMWTILTKNPYYHWSFDKYFYWTIYILNAMHFEFKIFEAMTIDLSNPTPWRILLETTLKKCHIARASNKIQKLIMITQLSFRLYQLNLAWYAHCFWTFSFEIDH